MKANAGWIDGSLLRDFATEHTDAHRLHNAEDGWVERYGSDILISYKTEPTRDRLMTELLFWGSTVDFQFRRIYGRYLAKQNDEREPPKLLLGDADINPQSTVTERYLQYGVDFGAGYSVGLFMDQRENRRYVRSVMPKRLLNCFAYTCSFSVAAASVGGETLSIDLSAKSLKRGKENFALNSLSTAGHRFIADDVFTVLPRLARKAETFDMIILDPPTFSQTKRGKPFQVERDLERLIGMALEVASRDARILISTNCAQMTTKGLELMSRFCLKIARRAGTFHREPAPAEFPPDVAARTVWLLLR